MVTGVRVEELLLGVDTDSKIVHVNFRVILFTDIDNSV